MEIKNYRQTHFNNSQTQQKFAKLLQMVAFYQNINFFTGNQSFKVLLSFALYFTRIGFQHFANISK